MGIDVESQIMGNIWKIETSVGAEVEEEDVLLIIESMKMEIPCESPADATVTLLHVAEGDQVSEDDVVATIQTV